MASTETTRGGKAAGGGKDSTVKETVISMVISLAMALVAKAYVVEAFVIPTGSMAPTLRGMHMQFESAQSGYDWAVNPWHYGRTEAGPVPLPVQGGGEAQPPLVADPMSTSVPQERWRLRDLSRRDGFSPRPEVKRRRAGDRILVQKFLYELFPPERWDVVVFKNPEKPAENFIKRLIGLPSEQVWLADGDVFTRPVTVEPDGEAVVAANTPGDSGWRVQRKPWDVQRRLWKPVYSSDRAPRDPVSGTPPVRWFFPPWVGEGWNTDGRTLTHEGGAPGPLRWDGERWPITDWEPYNEYPLHFRNHPDGLLTFPNGDVRVRFGFEPESAGSGVSVELAVRGRVWRAALPGDGSASISWRDTGDDAAPWTPAWEGAHGAARFGAGRVTDVELWHADQRLSLWVGGDRVGTAAYDWGPRERIERATGRPVTDFPAREGGLYAPAAFTGASPSIALAFTGGGAVRLHRAGVDTDLYYRSAVYRPTNLPAMGTHPDRLATLNAEQYFVAGDNSAASADSRLWERVDPAVIAGVGDDTVGVVNRQLMLGKAFFVYFPAPEALGGLPIPDFGRMRWIR